MSQLFRRLSSLILLLVFWCGLESKAFSCYYYIAEYPTEVVYAKSDAIFWGKLKEIIDVKKDTITYQYLRFEIKEKYKGNLGKEVTIQGATYSYICGYLYTKEDLDKESLIFVQKVKDELYFASNGLIGGWGDYTETERRQELDRIKEDIREKKKEGYVKEYYPSGGLKKQMYYHKGNLNGPFREYHPNGEIKTSGNFVDGQLDGPLYVYSGDTKKYHLDSGIPFAQ